MASHCGFSSNRSDIKEAEEDAAREREVYKYLQSSQDLLVAGYSQTPSKPHSSPDRALTAFAQLGSLRLSVRRAVISLIDRKYQYSLAEATRTLSLQKDTVDDEEDSIWLGQTRFARGRTPCEAAAGLLEFPELLSRGNREVFVVPNLEDHSLWSTHPLVTDRPRGRFYAGVPIVSPNGYNIGVYCVLDDKPRAGLSPTEIDFMKDMAITVMSHLEMVRAKAELDRSRNMVRGLGDFVDDKASLKGWWRNVSDGNSKDPTERSKPSRLNSAQSARRSSPKDSKIPFETDDSLDAVPAETAPPGRRISSRPSVESLREPTGLPPAVEQEATENASNLQEESISADVRSTFQKAADIIRHSVDVDGAIFLDASVGTFAGLVDKLKFRRNSSAGRDATPGSTASSTPMEDSFFSFGSAAEKPCIVLGQAMRGTSPDENHPQPSASLSVSERFLQSLLARYPNGKIWTYDPECSSTDTPNGLGDAAMQAAESINRRGKRSRERQTIQRLFPGVRSLALVGLWDPHRSRWFAGSILWTCSPIRILSPDNELNYMTAFGQSIMAEVARIDVKLADKAKATFISSISHELRTPLHGIMGSSECLQSTDLDAFQTSLINTIETCGRTLMDTFENLLSFAKINNLMTSSAGRRASASSKTGSSRSGTESVQTPIDLSVLAEEVVETVFAGHEFVRAAPTRNGPATEGAMSSNFKIDTIDTEPIDVILDYDTNENWVFTTQSGGWARVLLNLVGNSMKYTAKGSIVVRLSAKARSLSDRATEGDDEEVEVTLTVTDTGKGMTDEFLQSGAFQAFVQEDSLSPGTGLGLSIVKQIVTHSLGGTVTVQSEKNKGTAFQIVVCMTRAKAPVESTKLSVASAMSEVCHGKRINLVSPDGTANQAFVQLCKKWFGITIQCNPRPEEADVYVIMEEHTHIIARQLASLPESLNPLAQKPVIILCRDFTSAHALKSSSVTSSISCYVEYMSQPLGPNRVAKTLAACFDRISEPKTRSLLSRSSSRRISPARALGPRPSLNRVPSAFSTNSINSNPEIVLYTPSEEVTEDALFAGVSPSLEPKQSPIVTPISVLLVDDNNINLNLLATFMRKQRYSYGTANNGLDAVQAYQSAPSSGSRKPFDYVLMDINMPVMDGLESTRQIRAFERRAGLKPATIVALTGMASASAQQEAFASGVSLFLTKPVRFKELTRILDGKG